MRRFLSVIVALVLLTNVAISQSDITQGIKLIANENYGDATKFFESVSVKEPKNGIPIYYLGKIQYALEDYSGASSLFDKAALLDKKCYLCQIGQAQILLDNGKSAEADKIMLSVEKACKKNAAGMAAIGDGYLFSKNPNYAKAITYLSKSRDMDPKVGSTWAHLGDSYNSSGENGNAMSSYEVAVQKDKTNVEALVSMGKIWRASKNMELAVQNLEEAVKLDPTYAPAYKELIETYIRMERYSKVTPLLEKYIPLAGSDEQAKVRLVKFLCFQAKDYERAISEGETLKKTSKDYTINRWMAWSFIELKRYEEGYTAMKQFIADDSLLDPLKRKVVMIDYDYLAKAALNTNRIDEALEIYQKLFKQDPTKAVEVYTSLAKTYFETKNYEKAAEYYNKRDSIKELNNAELYRLAQSYIQIKNFAAGEKSLRKYISIDTSFVPAFYLLARTVANQDPDRLTWAAIPEYQKYLQVANAQTDKSKFVKNMIDAYMYVGVGLVQKEDLAGAKAAFDNILLLDPANEEAKKNSEILSKGGK